MMCQKGADLGGRGVVDNGHGGGGTKRKTIVSGHTNVQHVLTKVKVHQNETEMKRRKRMNKVQNGMENDAELRHSRAI